MTLLALIATAEAMLFSASQAKRYHARRQQVLMGNAVDSLRALRLLMDTSNGRTPEQAESRSSLPQRWQRSVA